MRGHGKVFIMIQFGACASVFAVESHYSQQPIRGSRQTWWWWAIIPSVVDSFVREDSFGDFLVDMPRMFTAWSNAPLALDSSGV
jgi:hypothetical protein